MTRPVAGFWAPAAVALALLTACGGPGAASSTASPDTPDAVGVAEPGGTPEPRSTVEPDGTPEPRSTVEPQLPVTLVDDTGTEVTVSSVDRIVPVDGDLTEIVFALGLGDRVVAVDLSATHPPAAAELPQVGYQRALSTEPIAAFEPTVVLATDLAGPAETVDELRAIGVPVVLIQRDLTLAGPAAKVRAVARALGVAAHGERLAAAVDQRMADVGAVAERVPPTERPRVAALYLRGTSVQLVFGRGSGVDAVLRGVGADDLGTEMGIEESAPIGDEALIAADPDHIVVSTRGLESVGGLEGLFDIPAVAGSSLSPDDVSVFDDQLLFGLGPRTGDLMAALLADLHPDLAADLPVPAPSPTAHTPTHPTPTHPTPTHPTPTPHTPMEER